MNWNIWEGQSSLKSKTLISVFFIIVIFLYKIKLIKFTHCENQLNGASK